MKKLLSNIPYKSLLLLIIAAHALWFLGAIVWKHIYNGDSHEYFFLAENLKHGIYYSLDATQPIDPFYISLRTPLYSVFIIFIEAVFGNANWILLLFQNIISIYVCWFSLKLFKPYLNHSKIWIYGLLILFYPAQMLFASMIVPDFLLQLFMVLYLFHLLKMISSQQSKWMWLMSLWLILAFLAKPIVYPFFLIHFFICTYWLYQFKALKYLPIALFPILIVVAYGTFIKNKTGFYHLSSVQAHNLLDYNLKTFHEFKYGFAKADSMNVAAHNISNQMPDFKSKYQCEEQIAKDSIKANFISYGLYHTYRSLRYFIEPGKGEIDLFTGFNTYEHMFSGQPAESMATQFEKYGWKGALNYIKGYPWLPLILLIFIFNLIRVFGFVIFLFSKKIPLSFRISIFIFVAYFAFITGPVSNFTRYYLPVLTITSAASMIGLSCILKKIKTAQ